MGRERRAEIMEVKIYQSDMTLRTLFSEKTIFDPDKRIDSNQKLDKNKDSGYNIDKRLEIDDSKINTGSETENESDQTKTPESSSSDNANESKDNSENQTSDTNGNELDNQNNEIEKNTRELTDEEKQWLKNTLGWSDKQIAKCTIDENGVIHYKTDRSDLDGKTSENGVPYERKQIEINGIKVEGVFPKFNSIFTTELSAENQKSNAYAKECNSKLKDAIQNNPELRAKFTDNQIKDIENGRTPTGYVWHHNEEQGKMELVKRSDHDRAIGGAAHTGGSALWGPDSNNKSQKGENF